MIIIITTIIIINNNDGTSQTHNLPRHVNSVMYFIDYRHEKTKEENQCCLTYLIKWTINILIVTSILFALS